MVAVDTSADPVKQKRKLCRKWQKKWVKFAQKKAVKERMKRVLQEALVEHGAAAEQMTVRALRDIVGQRLGFQLEGRRRVAFDKASLEVTAKPPAAKRRQKRLKLGARTIKKRSGCEGKRQC